MRVGIVGSGFAGSILARILRAQGHDTVLLERAKHPRFAIGESSTPLGAICLERLAARYGLEDLHAMAAYGRWMEHMPQVRRGLKRGFTFFRHTANREFANDHTNSHRLLVAASPSDAVADTHWLRSDVDHHLVKSAVTAGSEYVDRVELTELRSVGEGWELSGTRGGKAFRTTADVIVDASGPPGFVASRLDVADDLSGVPLQTSALFGHFENVGDFVSIASASGAAFPTGPYPDERAAVHHLLDEGWMYVLPFDHGVVSAGFVLDRMTPGDLAASPEDAWRQLLDRYPSLQRQFADATPLGDVRVIPRLQHRMSRASGNGWALLPHAFCFLSPMFSTGIAWSLLAVERLGLVFEEARSPAHLASSFTRYGELLEREAEHLVRLISPAYRLRRRFDIFAEYCHTYFVAASFAEAAQRLLDAPSATDAWAWEGFLGATDDVMSDIVGRAGTLATEALREETPETTVRLSDDLRRLYEPRNVAGLADPERNRLYPVDLDALVDAAPRLGLTRDAVRRALPRLRGVAA